MSVFSLRGVCFGLYSFILICVYEITYINANNVDPDQMPDSVASNLGLHNLPMSLLRDMRHQGLNSRLLCTIKNKLN